MLSAWCHVWKSAKIDWAQRFIRGKGQHAFICLHLRAVGQYKGRSAAWDWNGETFRLLQAALQGQVVSAEQRACKFWLQQLETQSFHICPAGGPQTCFSLTWKAYSVSKIHVALCSHHCIPLKESRGQHLISSCCELFRFRRFMRSEGPMKGSWLTWHFSAGPSWWHIAAHSEPGTGRLILEEPMW